MASGTMLRSSPMMANIELLCGEKKTMGNARRSEWWVKDSAMMKGGEVVCGWILPMRASPVMRPAAKRSWR